MKKLYNIVAFLAIITINGLLVSCMKVDDKVPVDKVIISFAGSESGPLRVQVGGTVYITAKMEPITLKWAKLTWNSADPSIATVDENGCVYGVKVGSTVITAVGANGKGSAQTSIGVEVVESDLPVNSTDPIDQGNAESRKM